MASYLDLSPGLFFLVWSDGKNDDVVIGQIVVKRTRKTKLDVEEKQAAIWETQSYLSPCLPTPPSF